MKGKGKGLRLQHRPRSKLSGLKLIVKQGYRISQLLKVDPAMHVTRVTLQQASKRKTTPARAGEVLQDEAA